MQGRQEPGARGQKPLDRSATAGYRLSDLTGRQPALDLTGRQPVIPRRPPGMAAHINQPPVTPRVARPQRGEDKVRRPKTASGWLLFAVISVVSLVLIGMVAYGVTKFTLATGISGGAASTANDFLSSLKNADYDQAYSDLSASAITQIAHDDFKQKALLDDRCYGQVTDYNEVDGSATSSTDGTIQSFVYNISRSKLSKPYELHLTLQKEASGDWQISSYGDDLGPAAPTPTCK